MQTLILFNSLRQMQVIVSSDLGFNADMIMIMIRYWKDST